MTRVLVAYGPATKNPSSYEAAKQQSDLDSWAAAHGAEVRVWRREGRSTLTKPIELRTRLHQALFCVRADFADDLWIPSWPASWGPWDEGLLWAVLAPSRGRLIVDGSIRRPVATDPIFRDAEAWWGLLEQLDPRKVRSDGPGDVPDIGAYLGPQEATRLARKLKDDFGLSDRAIADWLEKCDYESPAETPYTAGGVNHLLNASAVSEVDIERTSIDDAARPGTTLPKLAVATFGIDADRLVDRARRWDSRQPQQAGLVVPVTAQGQSSDPGTDPRSRPDLMSLLAIAPVLRAIHIGSQESLASHPHDRTFLLALLEHHGVEVLVDDKPLTAGCQGEGSASDYHRARSAIRLHQQLRAHDKGTVHDPNLSLAKARELAEKRRDQQLQRTLELIARELNEEGIPTRRGDGQWWPASVKALLERGQR